MKESLLTEVFFYAGLFFALAGLVIPLMRYCKIPSALGYLLAGIALGPYSISLLVDIFPFLPFIRLENADHIKILSELSIVLLLFVIGLELTPVRLWQMRNLVFGLGSAQVIATTLVIFTIAYLWGNNLQVSILLGLSLSLSSTAMIMSWLQEKKLFASPAGKTSFSILLLQDLAVIPILFLLTIFSADLGDNIAQYVSFSLMKMLAAGLAIYIVGKLILKHIFHFSNKHGGPEVFLALCCLVIIISASVAHLAGLSMALGAFIAGLILSETEYRHEVTSFIEPFKSMLLGIFFFSFGMGINLYFIAEKPLWLLASVIGLMTIKASIIFILCKLWKQPTALAAQAAISLSQAGEFGLLVVGSALTASLIQENIGQFMLITIGLTMMFTPLTLPLGLKIAQMIGQKESDHDQYKMPDHKNYKRHIVIFGYGRVGMKIGETLCEEGFSLIAFEQDVEKVKKAHSKSIPVFFGDVTKSSILDSANIDEALCIVITLNDAKATKKLIELIESKNRTVPIVVRAQNTDDNENFNQYGNVATIPEDVVIGKTLSDMVLKECTNTAGRG